MRDRSAKEQERMKAFSAIMLNADRLRNDALLLFDAGRFASAVALSVLALEEVGKLLILAETGQSKGVGSHPSKKAEVAKEFRQDLEHEAKFDLFCGRFEPGKVTHSPSSAEIDAHIAALAAISPRARFLRVLAEGTEDAKNRALYVDINPAAWIVKSSPAEITEAMARDWAVLANEAIRTGTLLLDALNGDVGDIIRSENINGRIQVIAIEADDEIA
jgi:AbiV family abortive infection protein